MTIYDISEKAGVSIATVSRVLNGSSNVSEKTRKKVLDIIEEYGYTPNAFARGLGLNTMKTIGIMCADSSDLYLAKAVYYIEQLLRANGYNSILCCSGYELTTKETSINLLINQKVDGIILVGSNFIYETEEENKYILEAAAQVPIMLLNAVLNAPNVYSTASDDYQAMYEATKTMIDSGLERILYYYNSNTYSGKRKLAGFMHAMKDCEVTAEKIHTLYFEGSHEDISGMTEALLRYAEEGNSFDGVIAADDYLALGAVKFAKLKNLSIPKDISILGCNNSMLVNCCYPELTSIDNKLESLCQHLINTLMDVLSGKDVPEQSVFFGRLIKRGTTR